MQGFDEIPDMMNAGRSLSVTRDNILALLDSIGIE
jgi:hypothetical protein